MPAKAQLLIHADDTHSASPAGNALQRWLARIGTRSRRAGTPGPLALQVHDLQGRRLAEIPDAGVLTRISLPAGTCVVTATRRGVRRGYTLTLEPGLSFDLHLNRGPPWP